MKKLFMTSGVILCMACPAFAAHDITPLGKDAENTDVTANCTNTYLDSYTGPVSLEAKWNPNIGTITLDSKRYANNGDTTGTAATQAVTQTPLYSIYGRGVYSTQPTTSTINNGNFDEEDRMTSLTATPTLTGYDFGGFYATKAGALAGTAAELVINSSGVFQYDAASTQVTAVNGSTTWYARWTAHQSTISFDCGTAPTGATVGGTAPADATLTYAATTYSVPTTAANCTISDGWHFKGWICSHDLATGTANANYASADNSSTPNYATPTNDNTGVIASASAAIASIGATTNVTCKALWVSNKVALTWKNGIGANGGSTITVDAASQNCNYGGGITLPNAPSRNGYTFTGWTVTNSGN